MRSDAEEGLRVEWLDADTVRPDGTAVRRMRHERGWSPRTLIEAVYEARRVATGVGETITPNLLAGIEDHDEPVPYETLCWLADGFDCDPVELLAPPVEAPE